MLQAHARATGGQLRKHSTGQVYACLLLACSVTVASRVTCLTLTHPEFTGGTWQMIMGFFALGTTLTGRLVVAQRVNSLPVTGMPVQATATNTTKFPTGCMHMCCRCNGESHCCETLESCVSCCLAPDHNASSLYSQDYRSPGR